MADHTAVLGGELLGDVPKRETFGGELAHDGLEAGNADLASGAGFATDLSGALEGGVGAGRRKFRELFAPPNTATRLSRGRLSPSNDLASPYQRPPLLACVLLFDSDSFRAAHIVVGGQRMHVDTDKDAYIPSTVVEHGLRSREFVYGRGKPMRIDGVRMSVHGIKLCVGVGATLASCYFAVPAQAQCLTIYSQCFDKTYYGTSVADIAEEWHADQNNLGGDGCNSVPCPFSGAASPSSTLVQVDDQCFVVQSDCTGVNYRYCPESCSECVDAAQCDDGNICNGLESCDLGQCAAGLPMNCDDGRSCTEDSCDPVMGCVNVPDESECCESPVMTNEAERAYSPYEPNYHRYVARTLVGVGWSEERKRDLFLRWRNGPNAAPGIPVNAPDDRPLQLARLPWDDKGENWIYIRTNEELLTWTNITLPGHYFHPGVVINRVETVGPFTYLV